jgi:hypothetical protein
MRRAAPRVTRRIFRDKLDRPWPARASTRTSRAARPRTAWTHLLYILAMNQLIRFRTQAPTQSAGQTRLGGAFTNVEANGIQNGPFVALNVNTAKIA